MCAKAGADPARIAAFKALALQAVDRLAQGDPRFGVLLDGRFGMRGLEAAADAPYWIGRPIELPGSRPLEFESSRRRGHRAAPPGRSNHVVKCLVFYHPTMRRTCASARSGSCCACRTPAARPATNCWWRSSPRATARSTTHTVVARHPAALRSGHETGLVEAGTRRQTRRPGRNIERAIGANDPHCRGVVLLGLSAPEEELIASFEAAASTPIVKGFAVGRTIFADAAEHWLAGEHRRRGRHRRPVAPLRRAGRCLARGEGRRRAATRGRLTCRRYA